jgi:general secretion pathway protein K
LGAAVAERSERGVALLIVLLAVALLTVMVLEFTYRSQVEYRRAAAWVRTRQARLAAESGVAIAAEMLARAPLLYSLQHGGEEKKVDGLTELWAQRCEPEGPSLCPINAGRGCTIDTFDAHRLAIRITDEGGRYNLNRLVKAGPAERERFARLLGRLGVAPELLDGITEWTSRGARGLTVSTPPEMLPHGKTLSYPVRAAKLETFGELGLLPNVRASDLIELGRLATVLDPAVDKINVNTAPLEVLASLHESLEDPTLLAQLQQARCTTPFVDETAMRTALGATSKLPFESLVTFKSEYFRVDATAEVDGFYYSVEALLFRKYPAEGAPSNRTEWEVRLVYYVPHRGPLIDPAMMEEQVTLDELAGGAAAVEGAF